MGRAIAVGRGEALVMPERCVAFLALEDGTAYFLFWAGADDGAHVLAAVLAIPETAWKRRRDTFTMTGTQLALIDSAQAGKGRPKVVGKLAPGRYTIDTTTGYDGRIRVGERLHDVEAGGLRLRPQR